MSKLVLIVALAGAIGFAGSKERDWQTGKILDNTLNPYFKVEAPKAEPLDETYGTPTALNQKSQDVERDSYVIESDDSVYLVERARVKMAPAAKVLKYVPLKFAIEKSKLWLIDAEGNQYQTKIVNQKRKPL